MISVFRSAPWQCARTWCASPRCRTACSGRARRAEAARRRARPTESGRAFEPLVEHDGHLVRGRGDEHLVLPPLRDVLPVAARQDLLLLVQQHHVLVQERRPEDVRHPRRRRQREQVELEPAVLPHLLALAALAHRRDEVPAPPRLRGDAVVRRQEPRLLVPPVDLQQRRRLKVVRRLGVVLADRVERRHRAGPARTGTPPQRSSAAPPRTGTPRGRRSASPRECGATPRRARGRWRFRKTPPHPYGMSRTCQWLRNAPPGAAPLLPTPSISGTSKAGVIAASSSASLPPSAPRPHQALRLHGGAGEGASADRP